MLTSRFIFITELPLKWDKQETEKLSLKSVCKHTFCKSYF